MNFESSAEQLELVSATARFLSERVPVARLRQPAYDDCRSHWLELAELGVFGITAIDTVGGLALDLADEALLFRELGRHLLATPVLATVIARRLAAARGDTALESALIGGHTFAAFAFDLLGEADAGAGALVLLDAASAEHILLIRPNRCALLRQSEVGGGAMETPLDDAGAVAFGTLLDSLPPTWCEDATVCHALTVLAAAYLMGIAEGALTRSVEHAKQRQQFGAPIGSFQAIKHLCADNAVRSDAAWSQVLWAALAVTEGAVDAAAQVAAAALLADEAARHSTQDNIQIHGAMGFTAEGDAHWFMKRRHVFGRLLSHAVDAYAAVLAGAQHTHQSKEA